MLIRSTAAMAALYCALLPAVASASPTLPMRFEGAVTFPLMGDYPFTMELLSGGRVRVPGRGILGSWALGATPATVDLVINGVATTGTINGWCMSGVYGAFGGAITGPWTACTTP